MKAIINANVVLEKGIIFNGALLIDGNRIVKVGKSEEVEIPKDCEVIDANGLFACPGLIDIHNHGSVKNFFIDNYDHIIIDGGVQLVDMVYLRKSIYTSIYE